MPRRCASLLAAILFAAPAYAFKPDLATLPTVPLHVLPAAAVQKALEETPVKGRPFRYAVAVDFNVPLSQGRWDAVDSATTAWRTRLRSGGARSISAQLSFLELPSEASVWVYDPAGRLLHGPYTAAQAPALWTPIVPGEELVIEVRGPSAMAKDFNFGVTRAFHGFRSWKEAEVQAKSGACNVDVACPQGDAWRNEIRSVARITIGNVALCSGQLVNNVRQDKTPLFLTADHCGIGESSGDTGSAASVVFYFNYQAATCNGARADPNLSDTLSGATLLADDVQSDFTLLRINQAVPAEYNVYYAGWDVTGRGSSSGVSIHHPTGDDKAISTYASDLVRTAANIGSACEIDSWQVHWRQPDGGTTEPGSSGGGLWSSGHRLIGVLSGGSSSCDNLTGADFYGRLDRAWTASGNRSGQLKAHLDPDGSCIAEVPGLDSSTRGFPVTSGPKLCSGPASTACVKEGGGGGAPSPYLLAGLIAAGLLRPVRRLRNRA